MLSQTCINFFLFGFPYSSKWHLWNSFRFKATFEWLSEGIKNKTLAYLNFWVNCAFNVNKTPLRRAAKQSFWIARTAQAQAEMERLTLAGY